MFRNPRAVAFVPDGLAFDQALARCTHLGIGAHQDDLEFMAFHGIVACRDSDIAWFGGVVCTDGGGSARSGPYADHSDDALRAVRIEEQDAAARLGRYGVMIQLGHPSAAVKTPGQPDLKIDLSAILAAATPEIVYCHNPADKHDTHIGVFAATLSAIRTLPLNQRPQKVYGCEVWRDLDWMLDAEKVVLDVSGHDALAGEINALFDSQISGGKRYDLAVLGRRRANATFSNAHSCDKAQMVTFAMDLTPLAHDDSLDVASYVTGFLDRLRHDVEGKLRRQFGA